MASPAVVGHPAPLGPPPIQPQAHNPLPIISHAAHLAAVHAAEARTAMADQMIEASKDGNVAVAHALLSQDPTLASCRDSVGQSPLMWAAYKGYTALAILLIQANAPLDDHDCQSSRSALYMACEFGNWPVASLLLQHGANPSFRRQLYGRTCLQIAAYNNHAHVVQGVLAFAASCPPSRPAPCVVDVNAVDNHGSTALHLAIRDDHLHAPSLPPSHAPTSSPDISDTVRVLLSWGADPLLPDLAGAVPLMVAQRLQHEKCISLLTGWERLALIHKARWCMREARQLEAHAAMESVMLGGKEDKRRRAQWEENREKGTLPTGGGFVARRLYQPSSSSLPSSERRMSGSWGGGREEGREGPPKPPKPVEYPNMFTLGRRSGSISSSISSSSSSGRSGRAMSLSLSESGSSFYSLPSSSFPSAPAVLPVLKKPRPPSLPPSPAKEDIEMGVSGAGGVTRGEGGREGGRMSEEEEEEEWERGNWREREKRKMQKETLAYVVHGMNFDTLLMLRETFG